MVAKTDAELEKLLVDTRLALREVRFKAAGSRPADSALPRKLRITIGRILTEMHTRATRSPVSPA